MPSRRIAEHREKELADYTARQVAHYMREQEQAAIDDPTLPLLNIDNEE